MPFPVIGLTFALRDSAAACARTNFATTRKL
jgi:hypothetical protein